MYCSKCGIKIADNSLFCPKCGTAVTQTASTNKSSNWNESSSHTNQTTSQYTGDYYRNAATSNFLCALAYIPILFWLPLVAAQDNPLGKKAANQGLWILIISMAGTIIHSVVRAIFNWSSGFLFNIIGGLFSGVIGLVFGMIQIALLVCIVIGFIHTYKGEDFEIPIVGQIELIH